MLLLTVIFDILVLSSGIRVPTFWPEQERRVIRDQTFQQPDGFYVNQPQTNLEGWPSNLNSNNKIKIQEFYAPNLERVQVLPADVVPLVPVYENLKKKRRDPVQSRSQQVLDTKQPGDVTGYSFTVDYGKNNNKNYVIKTQHNNPESQSVSYFNYNPEFPPVIVQNEWTPIIGQQILQVPNKIQESVYTRNNPDEKSNLVRNGDVNKITRRRYPSNHRRQYSDTNDRIDLDPASVYRLRNLERQRQPGKNHKPQAQPRRKNERRKEPEANLNFQTKPIYPGEGVWVKPGPKHRTFQPPVETKHEQEDEEVKPEGYEAFVATAPIFDKQSDRYADKIQSFPLLQSKVNQNQGAHEDESENQTTEDEDEDETEEFVPTRLLAQVRKSEDEQHLPSSLTDSRLRKTVKNSKIHTVYTEEGYEDVGYDHAGHEKNAEDSEGHADYEKKSGKAKDKLPKSIALNFDSVDVLKEFENYEKPEDDEGENEEASENQEEASENEEPSEEQEEASENQEGHSGNGEELSGNKEELSGNGEKLSGNGEKLSGNREELSENQKQLSGNRKLSGNEEKLSANKEELSGNQKKVSGNQKELFGNQEPFGNHKKNSEDQEKYLGNQEKHSENEWKFFENRDQPLEHENPKQNSEKEQQSAENREKHKKISDKLQEDPEKIFKGLEKEVEDAKIAESISGNINEEAKSKSENTKQEAKSKSGNTKEEASSKLGNIKEEATSKSGKIHLDHEVSESSYEELDDTKPKKNLTNKYSARKEDKTTEIKGLNDGSMELEITSEVKIMTQPNNMKTAHKFVKIVPKLKPRDRSLKSRRRKRFVNDLPKLDVEDDFLDVLHLKKPPKPIRIATTEKYPYYKTRDPEVNRNSPLRYAESFSNIPDKVPGEMSFYQHTKAFECPEIPREISPIPDKVERIIKKGTGDEELEEGEGDVAPLPDVPRIRALGDKIDCLKARYFGENPLDSPIFQEEVIGQPENIFRELNAIERSGKTESLNLEKQAKVLQTVQKAKEPREQTENISVASEHPENEEDEAFVDEDENNVADEDENSVEGEDENNVEDELDNVALNEDDLEDVSLKDHQEKIQTTDKPTLSTTSANVSPSTVAPTQPLGKNFIPKHIYDQIDFTEGFNPTPIPKIKSTPTPIPRIKSTPTPIPKIKYTPTHTTEINVAATESNKLMETNTTEKIEAQKLVQLENFYEDRQPRGFSVVAAPNLQASNSTEAANTAPKSGLTSDSDLDEDTEDLPESLALRIRKRRRKRPQRPIMHVFDINRYLPTPIPTYLTLPRTTTVQPKQKVLSEVYYKEEIQPSEQLNVFADVINNIKNSPKEPLLAEGSEHFDNLEDIQHDTSFSKNGARKVKVPPRKVRIKKPQGVKVIPITTTSTTTTRPVRRKNKPRNHKPNLNPEIYEEYLDTVKGYTELPFKIKPSLEDSFIAGDSSVSKPVLADDSDSLVDEVLGLSPPSPLEYLSVYETPEQVPLNTFYVAGMKPPTKHKPLSYSDFRLIQHNRIRRRNGPHRIHKRSPYKPSYSEIRRSKTSDDVEDKPKEEEVPVKEEDDDYVPQRNRNFRYDVQSGKVIYMNQKKEPEPEPEVVEEEEEEDDDEEYLPIVKATTPKPIVIITTEATGPSFLEYVQKLKTNTKYQEIEEPKSTEKPKEEPTTKSGLKETEASTAKQVVPEFLSIVSKLKSEDSYKEIKDKKIKSTTTPAPVEEEEEEEEEDEGEVRNSPRGGILGANTYEKMQIFDITEYLPQTKDYIPKTVIDYSKYKTIQRAPVARHNISSRYNSEDDELPFTTDRVSEGSEESIKVEAQPQNTRRSGYSDSEEDVEPVVVKTTTTTTEEPTTTRPKRILPRRKRPTTTTERAGAATTSSVSTTKRSRRRSRPTTVATTTTEPNLEENFSQTQRIIRRRRPVSEKQTVPPNHKAFYTPIVGEETNESKRPLVHRKRKVTRVATPNQVLGQENQTNSEEARPRKLADVEVFKKYNPVQRHGGNYRRESEEDSDPQALEVNPSRPTAYQLEDNKEIRRLSDVVPKPFAFYSDPTLPRSVNLLGEGKVGVQVDAETEDGSAKSSSDGGNVKDYSDYEDEVKINFSKKKEGVTDKPQVYIVKDPSKRLYFYAPVK